MSGRAMPGQGSRRNSVGGVRVNRHHSGVGMTVAIALVGVLVVFGVAGTFAAGAKASTGRLLFVADGPGCPALPDECPAIAMAGNGDNLANQAGGGPNPVTKNASGSGTF